MEKQVKIANEEEWLLGMELATISALPLALKAAVELDVFQIISDLGGQDRRHNPVSPTQIVSQMPTCTNPNAAVSLDRVLRVLAANSVLTSSLSPCGQHRLYALTPRCKYLVKNKDGVSMGHFVLMCVDKVFLNTWDAVSDAILHGGKLPFTKTYGVNVFEHCGRDPRFNNLFNKAMSEHSTMVVQELLNTYDGFKDIEELVDVAGGIGTTLNMIVSKYPHIRGINYDLPHWNLIDYSDEECVKILKNCYKALPVKGKLIVVDDVLPVAAETHLDSRKASNLDLMVFCYMPSGKERTEQEHRTLAKEAGFRDIQLVCCVNGMWVIEFYKQ
eukprot:Gb_38581 [translate_table: standard]